MEHVLSGSLGRGVAQTIYTHVSKCKNDKIKEKIFKKKERHFNNEEQKCKIDHVKRRVIVGGGA
jgi:macrodomain Ter protein organizer (MatP/YcbG family)